MPVSSPPYKDVPVAGQVQVLSPRPLSLSVPQTSSYPVYCAPELITAHAHTNVADEHREPIQQDSSMQCRRPVSTSPASVRSDSSMHFFNTHSPPLLNLSPNLSPSMSDVQVMSPCYDLRESTRRQSSLYGEEHTQLYLSFEVCQTWLKHVCENEIFWMSCAGELLWKYVCVLSRMWGLWSDCVYRCFDSEGHPKV